MRPISAPACIAAEQHADHSLEDLSRRRIAKDEGGREKKRKKKREKDGQPATTAEGKATNFIIRFAFSAEKERLIDVDNANAMPSAAPTAAQYDTASVLVEVGEEAFLLK